MFEKFFSAENIESSANYALFAGVFFTIIAFITSFLLFRSTPSFVGVATILFTVVLSLPIVFKFFQSTSTYDKFTFWSQTKHIFDFYIYFFIGSFVVLFLISLAFPSKVLSADQLYETEEKIVIPQSAGLPPPPIADSTLIKGIFSNNLYVMVIAFILSLLYGAGSLFLLTLNASIFASALSSVIRQSATNTDVVQIYTIISCNLGVMFFHLIPEVIGYFLAAIGGGIVSVSLVRDGFRSSEFWSAFKRAIILFISAVVVLFAAALIEVKISRPLLTGGTCLTSTTGVFVVTGIIILAVVILEIFRHKKSKKEAFI